MKCPSCGGVMIKGRINLPYEIGEDKVIVVKGVPAWVCEQCGDSFVEIEVARKVEKIVEAAEKDGVTLGFVEYREAA